MIKVKFKINKNLDYEVCNKFLHASKGGVNFRNMILATHPKLRKMSDQSEIEQYIDRYYEKNLKNIEAKRKILQSKWDKINDKFIKKIENIFDFKFSKGKYIGFLSIFDCNPRFLQDKTFQIFYKKPNLNCMIIKII